MLELEIFSDSQVQDEGYVVGFNTGTLLDLHLGVYLMGVNGRWYFNGGFGNYIIIVEAEPNQHKSTLSDSLMLCCAANYPNTKFFNLENEGNKNAARLRRFINSLLHGYGTTDVGHRTILKSHKDCPIEAVDEQVQEICDSIKPMLKKMWMDTPFGLNDSFAKVLFPTFFSIDSFTNPNTRDNEKKVDGAEVTDSTNNMDAMNIGRAKTRYVPKLSRQINDHGLCAVATVQLGEKKAALGANPNIPVAGDTPHAKSGKTAKRVGTELIKRSMATIQILSVKSPMKKGDMKAEKMEAVGSEYPLGDTPPNDIQSMTVSTSRNKLAPSGVQLDMIISQSDGLLPDVTNFHFLRNIQKGYNGFSKASGGRWVLDLYPEFTITRSNLRRECLSNYKLARALDLSARYVYLRSARGRNYLNMDWSMTLAELRQKLLDKGFDMDMILESTEIWMPNEKTDSDGFVLGAHGRRHYTIVQLVEEATKDLS